ncbi:MAG: sigma-54-dependent transcriptional regulator [Syntrophobacteraceae bacterium]
MARILIIEGDESWRTHLSQAFSPNHHLKSCSDYREAQILLQKHAFNMILFDLPNHLEEIDLLEKLMAAAPNTPVIVTSTREKAELIVKVIKAGALDFIPKPYTIERLRLAAENALTKVSLKNEINYLRRQQDIIYDLDKIIAVSPCMKAIMATIKKLVGTDSTILMTGETGTGKSLISGAMHFNSPRRNNPFIKINCANIPETLLESELFGHAKGAFTGAGTARTGRLEQANGGTVFLDEIGELSAPVQAKFLRVLEDRCFERLGENRTIYSDIRIIAATNRNLEEQVAAGTFRQDLFYRINVLRVHLPPLRERRECIKPFADHLLDKICRSVKKQVDGFSPDVIELFNRYSWPGNIRELSNTIERAVLLEESRVIQRDNIYLPGSGLIQGTHKPSRPNESLHDHEKELILDALENSLWVQKDAAARLGVSPRVMHYKIRKYGITHHRWHKNN